MNKPTVNSSRNNSMEIPFAVGEHSGRKVVAEVIGPPEVVRTEENAFHNFFDMESIGYTLFVSPNGIRSYLSINDLIPFSITSRGMHNMCGMFTVLEFLEGKSCSLSKQHRIRLGIDVMAKVTTYRTRTTKRPGRLLFDSADQNHFWAKLYHPNELEEVTQIVDGHLNVLGRDSLILIHASFDEIGKLGGYNVTSQIAKLAKKHKGRLILQPPAPILNGHGKKSYKPTTFKWWYTRLFGDPCPCTSKQLVITTRHPISGKVQKHRFNENRSVDLHLNSENLEVLAKNKTKT